MDWTALWLSCALAAWTLVLLMPAAILLGRFLATARWRGKAWIEGLIALPLVLPPTVIGFYLLTAFGRQSLLGRAFESLSGHTLAFSFEGLVVASLIFNLPFAIQPMQRAFEAIPDNIREAAECCGLGWWQALFKIELPLAWPGLVTAAVMTFAHTLGEFGVVLMVGGNIDAETRTVAVSIYDKVQALDTASAGQMSLMLLLIACLAMAIVNWTAHRPAARRHG